MAISAEKHEKIRAMLLAMGEQPRLEVQKPKRVKETSARPPARAPEGRRPVVVSDSSD